MKSRAGGLLAGLPAAGDIGGCAALISLLKTFLPLLVSKPLTAVLKISRPREQTQPDSRTSNCLSKRGAQDSEFSIDAPLADARRM